MCAHALTDAHTYISAYTCIYTSICTDGCIYIYSRSKRTAIGVPAVIALVTLACIVLILITCYCKGLLKSRSRSTSATAIRSDRRRRPATNTTNRSRRPMVTSPLMPDALPPSTMNSIAYLLRGEYLRTGCLL